jgi:hypothetical protein
MFIASISRLVSSKLAAAAESGSPVRRRHGAPDARCEALEPRRLLSGFTFSTGAPDGKIATIAEPASLHNGDVEYESADDFVLASQTTLRHATFTGLLTGGATPADVSNVIVEIYRVFPKDSDLNRTPHVPTRVNSPSDVAFESRDSSSSELNFDVEVLSASFSADKSVSSQNKIAVNSGGNGPVTGQEVEFEVTFRNHPIELPADHYFFVPQVGLSDSAPAGAHFLWLSAPKPIVAPGTPFTPDLQSWMRDDPPLAPDWLRIGTDIIGGAPAPTFNASFSLDGVVRPPQAKRDLPEPGASAIASSSSASDATTIVDLAAGSKDADGVV